MTIQNQEHHAKNGMEGGPTRINFLIILPTVKRQVSRKKRQECLAKTKNIKPSREKHQERSDKRIVKREASRKKRQKNQN